jgi:solute carrier family 45 protein 1/2/4
MPQNVRHSQQNLGENSPLLLPQSGNDDRDSDISTIVSTDCNIAEGEDAQEESKSMWYLFLLTISIGGLQIAWAVELSNGSPYLLSLGMSKALLALVWIAGPLSGTIVQPYIGIKSDNSRMSWGKRKPFMIGGAIATIFSLLALAWARDMMQGFLGLFGVDSESLAVKNTTIVFAIIAVFILDFAINTGMLHFVFFKDHNSNFCSASSHSSLHCRQCSCPPAGIRKCLGRAYVGCWKCRWVPVWLR